MSQTTLAPSHHIPVLLHEVVRDLAPQAHHIIVDCTLGGGGYALEVLETTQARYIGIDQDPCAIQRAQHLTVRFPDRFQAIHGAASDLDMILGHLDIGSIDGFVADLGMSSDQLDDPERGFSFMRDGPLDMRMNPHSALSASLVVNTYKEADIANILWTWGEEPKARHIARAIVAERVRQPIERTTQLARLIVRLTPRYRTTHPATRTFQALRIFVNQEINQLHRMLQASTERLSEGGRLVIVSFHSLEDRIVKRHIRDHTQVMPGRLLPGEIPPPSPPFFLESLHKGAICPQRSEQEHNPRARSARLRSAVKRIAA